MKKVLKSVLLVMALALVSLFATRVQAVENSIVDVAAADGRFTQLLGAAETVGLANMLDNNGPFTVFAPTDDAFAALGEETIASLSETQLRQILLYHIVQGAVKAEDVVGLSSAKTALGEDVGISVADGGVVLAGASSANVIITDVEAANGVIHVIDAVLLPPSFAPADSGDMGDGGNDDPGDSGEMPDPSDSEAFFASVNRLREIIQNLNRILDASNQGQNINCDAFVENYEAIDNLSFFDEIGGDFVELRDEYVKSIDNALATGEGIYMSCTDGDGKVNSLDWGIARQNFGHVDSMIGGVQEILIGVFGEMDEPAPVDEDEDDGDDSGDGPAPMPSGEGVELLGAVRTLRQAVNNMVYVLDSSNNGQDIDCDLFMINYETARTLPSYGDLSGEFAGLRDRYTANREAALEAAEGVAATCEDGDGKLGALDSDITRNKIADAANSIGRLEADVVAITGEVETDAPDPVESPADDDEEMEMEEEMGDGGEEPPMDDMEMGEMPTDEEIEQFIQACIASYVVRGADVAENGPIPYDETEFVCDLVALDIFYTLAVSYLDDVHAGNTSACSGADDMLDSYIDMMILSLLAPEYVDIPGEVQPLYDRHINNIIGTFSANEPAVNHCLDNTELTEDGYWQSRAALESGRAELLNILDEFTVMIGADGQGLTIDQLQWSKAIRLDNASIYSVYGQPQVEILQSGR